MTEKLDMLMAERGVNKAELARLSDIPYTTIVGLYEKGYDNTKLSTLIKLSNYFNCTIDYLADDNVEKPAAKCDGLSELDVELINMMSGLSPEDAVIVRSLVKSLKARKE